MAFIMQKGVAAGPMGVMPALPWVLG